MTPLTSPFMRFPETGFSVWVSDIWPFEEELLHIYYMHFSNAVIIRAKELMLQGTDLLSCMLLPSFLTIHFHILSHFSSLLLQLLEDLGKLYTKTSCSIPSFLSIDKFKNYK